MPVREQDVGYGRKDLNPFLLGQSVFIIGWGIAVDSDISYLFFSNMGIQHRLKSCQLIGDFFTVGILPYYIIWPGQNIQDLVIG